MALVFIGVFINCSLRHSFNSQRVQRGRGTEKDTEIHLDLGFTQYELFLVSH